MFNTSWDVDKYKSEHESDQHWALRRQFMVAHKHKYPEPTLVCLTQVFFNMEFLGCKYPEKTMKLVNELATEVAQEFRESRKHSLKRTFVGAQDAAGAKAKGVMPPPGVTEGAQSQQQVEGPAEKRPRHDQETEQPPPSVADVKPSQDIKDHTADLREVSKTFIFMIPIRVNSKAEKRPESVMHTNFPKQLMAMKIEGSKKDGWAIELRVNPSLNKNTGKPKHLIASAFAMTQKKAREQVCANAINNLKKFCTYVEPNPEWFEGTPEFIKNPTPCTENSSYVIMTKAITGHVSPEVANNLVFNFKRSATEEMYFLQNEFNEKEKVQLLELSQWHNVEFRHFGSKRMLKDNHICIYKKKYPEEIVEEARKLNWKHPKYFVTLKNEETSAKSPPRPNWGDE